MNNNHFCCIAQPANVPYGAVGVLNKFWPMKHIITVGFIGGTSQQHQQVRKAASKWAQEINLSFDFGVPVNDCEVRIAFQEGAGSWSYLGTDCRLISAPNATMNFGWLDDDTILHEFGHMLGLAHEHQNPNEPIEWDLDAIYADLSQAPNFWDMDTIKHNIISRYETYEVDATPTDAESIMMYQIPARWTKNGFSAGINEGLSNTDIEFIRRLYPPETTLRQMTPETRRVLQATFPTLKDLKRLTEKQILAIGQTYNLDVMADYLKVNNAEIVFLYIHNEIIT